MFTLVFLAPLLSLLSSAVHLVGCSDGDGPVSTATPTPVSAQDIAEKFVRPAHFSQLAYCPSDLVKAWNCGQSCQAMQMGGFNLLTAGGGTIPSYLLGGVVVSCGLISDNVRYKMARLSPIVGP